MAGNNARILMTPQLVIFVVTIILPLIGSKAVRGVLNLDLEDSPSGHSPGPPPALSSDPEENSGNSVLSELQGVSSSNDSHNFSSACNLVPLTFDDRSSTGVQLRSYDDKFLIHVSHSTFEIANGVVPTLIYQVSVEVPSGHEFSLEYWVNGLSEEWKGLKRRHQRDRREVLELFPTQASADQVVFCSKNSIAGLNTDSTSKLFTFNWFLNIHPTSPSLSPSSSASSWSSATNSKVPGLPTTTIFRLRFRSIVETTSSVFEQNLSISVRPNCALVLNVNERVKLTLSHLWNSRLENKGLNCTVLVRPKKEFGFELRLTNLSIYGIRDSCKRRYLSLMSPSSFVSGSENQHDDQQRSSNSEPRLDEFANPSSSTVLNGEKKFCGKIEDYSSEERTLTFPARRNEEFAGDSSSSDPLNNNNNQDKLMMNIMQVPENSQSDLRSSSSSGGKNSKGVLLTVVLPSALKPKEQFALELIPLSPCQKVHLTRLNGQLKYERASGEHVDECSITIHVPYGNTILTKLKFENSALRGDSDADDDDEGNNQSNNNNNSDDSYNNEDNNVKSSNNNMSNSVPPVVRNSDDPEDDDDEDILDSNNECETSLTMDGMDNNSNNKNNNNAAAGVKMKDDGDKLLIQVRDLTRDMVYKWCVDGRGGNYYHRAWRSSGNHIAISFKLKYFDRFHLSYQSFNIPEITGQCETGWVTLDYGCVTLLETPASWHAAEEDCKSHGGHLATVRDELAEQKIEKIITESALYHPSRAYWIGANDRDSEGSFQWTSGLPFMYSNWFPGWTYKGNDVVNAQPNDDGFSGQDCVELRQRFSSYSTQHGKNLEINSISVKGSFVPVTSNEKFYWNDRHCETKNFYLCEKATHQKQDFSCNQTLRLPANGVEFVTVTSPAYPSSYPDNTICVTTVETVPGYRLIVQFEEFVLEESPSCKYDSLEIYETSDTGQILGRNEKNNGIQGDLEKGEDDNGFWVRPERERDHLEFPLHRDKERRLERICGNWNKRLKLLRYGTSVGTGQIHFKFESDFSHHFAGFKARVTTEIVKGWLTEKEKNEQCVDQHMQRFGSNCYLFVSFPPVNWNTAHQTCLSMKGNLVSILSFEEWNFLTRNLISGRNADRKATYWLGGFIDQNSQLVWMDRMPFNFSAFHVSDLMTISNWKCLSLYWHEGGKGEFAWRLSECKQLSGYICKKHTQVEVKHGFNRTLSGTGGKLTSPNFPANYYNNLDYTNHLVAPNGTQIVVRFSHLDVEAQEDCLYDYVEIIDRKTKNATRYCGSHLNDELDKLDYVSSSNEVDVVFHTDYADSFTGFEIIWRAVDVSGCLAGRTILTGIGHGFPIHDSTIFTPNFPHFNLPGLNCTYTIVAPAGQRIWLSFQIFEIGKKPGDTDGISLASDYCEGEDRVVIDLGTTSEPSNEDGPMNDELTKNELFLCGNLTGAPHRVSFVSYRERITVRVFSPKGKTGRGILGKFKAIPMSLRENLVVITEPNSTFSLASVNYPLVPPNAVNFTMSLSAPPNYVVAMRIRGKSYPKCHFTVTSYLEVRDPYAKAGTVPYIICQPDETESISLTELLLESSDNENAKVAAHSLTGLDSTFTFRSSFNRLDVRQIYSPGSRGRKWTAQIATSWDQRFRDKVLGSDDSLLNVKSCNPNPCLNGGRCSSEQGRNVCRCNPPYTGPFCGLSFCDLSPCLFGKCVLVEKAYRCECQLGYSGENCDKRKKPCDERPCTGHGDCVETANSSYKCICHAYWEGPRCEARMSHIPYKPLSQRMLKEPFWLGMITVTVVLGIIGLVWCLKRHFPEKLDKLLNDDMDRNRGISWVSGRSPSSIRIGSGSGVAVKDPVPGTSQQSNSPPTSRSFLGRFGIRKPSLLSLSSATSAVSVTASSPHQYENRTFSLDDLLRPTRSMMRTPSPHRRRNYSIQVRRDPAEKQQILQQLVSSGGSQSLDGEIKPSTPKPTIAEIIQMSEKRLRLASASSVTSDTMGDKKQSSLEGEAETSFTNATPSIMLTPTSKAEKKVTFARLLDKLAATEMSSSSSCSDISCAEDKTVVVPPKPPERKKERKGRFRRSKSYNRGRSSETDQDVVEMSSSDTTPDPICPPRFPTRLCISPTGSSSPSNQPASLLASGNNGKLQASKKMASADSLLALFRRFSGSSSAPPSPQYSENEESSTVDGHTDLGVNTPVSTPSSPRSSSVRPPGLVITSVDHGNTIEVPVIDPFGQQNNWRTGQTSSITLEVPLRDYCLSPIHEVPTPLPTPSHSPAHTPLMHRPKQGTESVPMIKVLASSEDEGNSNGKRSFLEPIPPSHAPKLSVPIISISLDGEDEELEMDAPPTPMMEKHGNDYRTVPGETEVIPDVLIHVPPEVSLESKPDRTDTGSPADENSAFVFPTPPVRPPRLMREKHKPPPLIFANEILSCGDSKDEADVSEKPKAEIVVPALSIECATPLEEIKPKFVKQLAAEASSPLIYCNQISTKPWDMNSSHPLAPPMITINQSSEAESDSDTPVIRKIIRRPNLTFLSPFVGSSDRVPSESNLSTSGYSSMASPCPSRCPSVSPLCPSEAEDNYGSTNHHGSQGSYGRRSSLTPATPRKSSLTHRRCSLNAASPLVSSYSRDNSTSFNEEYERDDKAMDNVDQNLGFETDSAVEVEAETDIDNQPNTPTDLTPIVAVEDMKIDFLQVPRKNIPKSRSLDMNVPSADHRKNQLKGDSLDSKLNTVDPSGENFSRFMENVCSKTGSILEMPEDNLSDKIRLSPVSSRSDSPISELSVVCLGVVSPITDSDGLYDCPSSEVPNGGKSIGKEQPLRRSSRKRERKLSATAGQRKNDSITGRGEKPDEFLRSSNKDQVTHSQTTVSAMDEVTGKVVSSGIVTGSTGEGVKSPRRRVRVSSFVPSTSSSSSAESLNSPSRGYGSSGSTALTGKQSVSPLAFPLLQEKSAELRATTLNVEWTPQSTSNEQISGDVMAGSGDLQRSCAVSPTKEKGSNKFSRLRTISNQIRFLRRLEMSLLRKKESLGVVTGRMERRDSLLSISDSSESRCDTTSSDTQSSVSESYLTLADAEQPLISLKSIVATSSCRRKRRTRSRNVISPSRNRAKSPQQQQQSSDSSSLLVAMGLKTDSASCQEQQQKSSSSSSSASSKPGNDSV